MISGKMSGAGQGWYQIKLENGQSFKLEEKYLPVSLRSREGGINLVFGSHDGPAGGPEEARALLNYLLGNEI